MKYSSSKEVDRLIRQLLAQGWTYEPKDRGRHDKLVAPNGQKIPVLRKEGDPRTLKNWQHQIKRLWTDLERNPDAAQSSADPGVGTDQQD